MPRRDGRSRLLSEEASPAAMELVEESADEEDEDALGEYLEEEGFDDEADEAARDAFGGRD